MSSKTASDRTAHEMRATQVGELPAHECPICETPLLPNFHELQFAEVEKIRSWTLAQLIAFRQLQERSGFTFSELLAETRVQARPGIGAIANPTVLGVNLRGMFVGIETDGYTHS